MHLSKFLKVLFVLSLLALVIPIAIARGDVGGTAVVRESAATLSNQLVASLTGMPVLGDNEVYEGWLVSDDGEKKLSVGIMAVDSEGNIDHTFTHSGWANLTSIYDKFVVTVEPVPDTDSGPSGIVTASDLIPAGGMAHIRHLLYSWAGNPEYSSGVYSSNGLLIDLWAQNDSGQSGWASLNQNGADLDVVLWLAPGAMESNLVHIHTGQCDTLGGVEHGLSSFSGGSGMSTSTLPGVSLSGLITGGFAVNAHNAADAGVNTACGDIQIPMLPFLRESQ